MKVGDLVVHGDCVGIITYLWPSSFDADRKIVVLFDGGEYNVFMEDVEVIDEAG